MHLAYTTPTLYEALHKDQECIQISFFIKRIIGLETGRKEIISKGGGGKDSRQRKQHMCHLSKGCLPYTI